jgi:hypothetical protein
MRRAIVVLLLLIANALFGSHKVRTTSEASRPTEVAQTASAAPLSPCEPEARARL